MAALEKTGQIDPGLNGQMLHQPDQNRFFGHYELEKNGLYLPSDLTEALNGLKNGNLDKAAAMAQEERVNRKIGALYSLMYSLYTTSAQWGSAEKSYDTPTHRLLREIWAKSLLDRLIVASRMRQLRHVARRVTVQGREKGWYVTHMQSKDPNFKMTKDILDRCREVEFMLNTPNAEPHPTGFRDVLMKAVQGELIIDRKALVVVERNSRGKPLSWHLLPPDDIKPRFKVLLKFMLDYKWTTVSQAVVNIKNKFGVDLTDKAYIQEIDGRVLGAWRSDEMYVDIVNPSDEINRQGFGISPLENSLDSTTLLIMGMQYNKNIFLSNYPEAFLILKGEFSPAGLQAFKNMIYSEVGPQGNLRLPVLPTGNSEYDAELLRLRDTMTDMQFVQLIRLAICLKCAAYGMHPATLNFSPDMGASTTGVMAQEETQEAQIALAQEEGFHSLLDTMSDWFNRSLIWPWYDDLHMRWNVEDQPTEVQRIDLWTKKLAMGSTVDEWRHDEGLSTLEEATGGKVSGEFINSPFFFQQVETQMMMDQAQQQMQQEAMRASGEGFEGGAEKQGIEQKQAATKTVLARTNKGATPRPGKPGGASRNGAKPKAASE